MPQISFWKQSPAERASTFDTVFAEVQPADAKSPSVKAQLKLVQKLIVKKRTEGFTHEQIAERLKDPRIGIDVTPGYIRTILREVARMREKRRKARVAATIAAAQRAISAKQTASNPPSNSPSKP